jgi:hypothetical protein
MQGNFAWSKIMDQNIYLHAQAHLSSPFRYQDPSPNLVGNLVGIYQFPSLSSKRALERYTLAGWQSQWRTSRTEWQPGYNTRSLWYFRRECHTTLKSSPGKCNLWTVLQYLLQERRWSSGDDHTYRSRVRLHIFHTGVSTTSRVHTQ